MEAPETPIDLSEQEQIVLRHIAEGKTITEISMLLSLPSHIIETARQNIMQKLKIYTVAELTKYAIQKGLTSLNQ